MSPVEQRATELLAALEAGPATAGELRLKLGMGTGTFDAALRHAREVLCPILGVVIPHPIPSDGWRYRLTGAWLTDENGPAAEAGTEYALGAIEVRLGSILRDVQIILPNLPHGSVAWRRCNFLKKHLTHITSTFAEISATNNAQPEKEVA